MGKTVIVGGGAAGMTAAVFAARQGEQVHIFEQNEKLGKKLFITGKGRCNFTNACEDEEFFRNVTRNPKFLYSSFYGFNTQDVITFFEELGVRTKVERGNRAFPQSDHSSDIIRAFERELRRLDVKIHLKSKVKTLVIREERAAGVLLENGAVIEADAVIVTTGGLSYPSTGATGDGYAFAESAGHKVEECAPCLVPLVTQEDYIPKLQGLSLKNVRLTIMDGKKKIYEDFGEMLFTHFGISGPLVLSASSYVGGMLKKKTLQAFIDLKPALSEEKLDARLKRLFEEGKNKQFKNVVTELFPSKLIPVMLQLGKIPEEKKVNEISKEERREFLQLMKAFPMTLVGMGEYKEAIITRGGVSVKEINPKTMESKKIESLYFAGEVLDLDALTGGFNLQIAWSTGHAAALGVGRKHEL